MGHYIIRTIQEKKRIIKYYQKHGKEATLKKYYVHWVSLLEWLKLIEKGDGSASWDELLARKPKRHTVKEEAIVLVKKLYAEDPTLSLRDLKEKVKHIQNISRTTIWHATRGR